MEFCMTSSLVLNCCEQKYCQTLGNKPNQSHSVLRGWLFSKGKIEIFVSFSVPCFSKKFANLFAGTICGSYVTKINAVLWHSAQQTFALLGLFTWLICICMYCVPIATLNQNKRTLFGQCPNNKHPLPSPLLIFTRVVRKFWSRWLSCLSKRPALKELVSTKGTSLYGGLGTCSPRKFLQLFTLKCCFLHFPVYFLSKITENLKWIIRWITDCRH